MEHPYYSIQSINHQLGTVHKTKKNLSSVDDKRYLLSDRIHTLPYGHWACLVNNGEPHNNKNEMQ